jgi:hypothetical protein
MLGSIRRRANYELRQLARANRQAQLARYGVARRCLRFCIGERNIFWFLSFYLLVCAVACLCEGYVTATHPAWLPGWVDDGVLGRLKDFGGFLITAQVGLLAVVSVAVGVVTFIAQRDDRTSTTEVGLYYTESLSYEIVASSSALLLVLCVQLFWPLQGLLHILGYGGRDMVFAVSLTVLHACWLALNVLLFSQFLLVTLRFVEPKARERMRKRFTANIITPNYNRANLLNMLYMHAPGAMVPDADSKKGTYITFGYGTVSDGGEVEIETDFRRPTKLFDVWTRPLGIVLRRWHARSVKSLDANPKRRNLFGGNLIALALRLGFESVYDQPFGWAVRLRGSPLQQWEKWVIRQCFRFRRFHDSELALPTPTTLLEELLDRVIGQIDRLTQVGFKSALFEAADYHRFLLETQDTVDDKGQPLNFSQIGGYFQRPYEEWVHQYRRVIEKAVEKIGIDNYFVNYMGHIIVLLLPRSAVGVATPTVVSLLDIGAFEVSLLERWFISATSIVTRDGAERRELPGSSQRAFEEVIDDFVGAWETVLKSADALYDWRMSKKEDSAAYWKSLTNSWPYLRQHLYTSAYFVASAVWNEDSISTARYRDMLVRWQDSIRFDDRGEFLVKKRQLLAPDLFALDWECVAAHSESFKQYPGGEPLQPETLVRMALRNGFTDALLVSAAVLLQWHMQEKSDLSAETSADLVFRRAIEADGSRLGDGFGGEDIHRSLWGLVARYALTKRGDGSYTSGLDVMVRRLSGMAERRMISGRVYSSVGLDGVEAIAPQILILLAATLPEGDDQNIITWFREIAEAPESLPEGDASLRHLIWKLQAYERYWKDLAGTDGLTAGIRAISPTADVAAATVRFAALLPALIAAIEEVRAARLLSTEIDTGKLSALRDALEKVILTKSIEVSCFRDFEQSLSDTQTDIVQSFPVTGINKADYITPPMTDVASDFEEYLAQRFAQGMSWWVWNFFWDLNWRVVQIEAEMNTPVFWDQIIAEAAHVGPEPAALVPNAVGGAVMSWRYGDPDAAPAGRTVRAADDRKGGYMAGYVGTIDDVDVFMNNFRPNDSRVFSQTMLETVVYHPLADGHYVSVEFEPGDDPRQSKLIIKYSLKVVWRHHEVVKILTTDVAEADEEEAD